MDMSGLSDLQKNTLLSSFIDLDQRLADLDAMMYTAEHPSPLSRYVLDLSPVEMGVIRDYCQRLRSAMLDLIAEEQIRVAIRPVGLRWAIQTNVSYMHVAVGEMSSEKLRGYGSLSQEGKIAADRLSQRLDQLVDQLASFLRERPEDVKQRLAHAAAPAELWQIVEKVAEIITRRGLVEYRPKLNALLDRLERAELEIAVFGRVSSGKSSLLNHIAGTDVLPVGVTPITAVPTRLTWGEIPLAKISFAESTPRQVEVSEVAEYASEEKNPGNTRHVTRIEVEMSSPRLQSGVVFVDTPGIGSLARRGSAETFAYLPRCDLGVVLIDSSSTLNDDDISLIRLLRDAGAPVQVLLSKVDLLSAQDRRRMTDYLTQRLTEQFGTDLPVFAVSVMQGYEQLWQEWFEHEVVPMQREHQRLASESLQRKALRLVEGIRAVLEARLSKDKSLASRTVVHIDQVRQLLASGDDVLRELHATTIRWRDQLRPADEEVIEQAAQGVVDRTAGQHDGKLRDALQKVLSQRAELAWRIVTDAKARLAKLVRELLNTTNAAEIDAEALGDLAVHGLPSPDESLLEDGEAGDTPWWGSLAPPLARRSVASSLRHKFGSALSVACSKHERALDLWLRTTAGSLQEAYEAQVAALRRRVQRAGGGSGELEASREELLRDLQILQEIMGPTSHPPSEVLQPDLAAPTGATAD